MVLIALGIIIPIHSQLVPNLGNFFRTKISFFIRFSFFIAVLLYSYSLIGTAVCVIIEVIVINLSRNTQSCTLPHVLTKILTSLFLKMFLCLPEIEVTFM